MIIKTNAVTHSPKEQSTIRDKTIQLLVYFGQLSPKVLQQCSNATMQQWFNIHQWRGCIYRTTNERLEKKRSDALEVPSLAPMKPVYLPVPMVAVVYTYCYISLRIAT